jgi:GST-like protein
MIVIDLYFAQTPNNAKILLALKELDLPYTIIRYDLYAGEHLNATLRGINPNMKIPAIVDHDPFDGGEPISVFESAAILIYLAEKYHRLLPENPRDRLQAIQWLTWQVAGLGPMFGQAGHFVRYAQPPGDHRYATERYINESRRLMNVLERRLKQTPYLAGVEYSIADIASWPVVYYFSMFLQFDYDILPSVKRWLDDIVKRPAAQATINSPEMDPGRYYDVRPVLTQQEWSNVFGERMLEASK